MNARDTIERSHRFTIAPEHLILDPRLSDRAFRLWCRLDRFVGDKVSAFPSREALSVELDCSLASIDRALQELVSAAWLDKEQTGPGGGNLYRLLVVPKDDVIDLIEDAREERRARWGGQRTRQRKASKERKAQVTASVVTHEDTTCVVTRDGQVSSPVTPSVVTGDAQKEATRSENQGSETDPGTPLRDAPQGEATVVDIDAAKGGTRRDPVVEAAADLARKIVTQYMDWWKQDRGMPSGQSIPESSRVFNILVGKAATTRGCSYVTAAVLQQFTRDQIALALGTWASPPDARKPSGLVPSKGAWTEALAAVSAGRSDARPPATPQVSKNDAMVAANAERYRAMKAASAGGRP